MLKSYWRDTRWGFMAWLSGVFLYNAVYGFCTKAWISGSINTVAFALWLWLAQNAWDEVK